MSYPPCTTCELTRELYGRDCAEHRQLTGAELDRAITGMAATGDRELRRMASYGVGLRRELGDRP